MYSGQRHYFHWADYVVMAFMLVLSLAIGVFFGCFGTKQGTDSEYLRGDRKMRMWPVAISLVGGYISGITLLGTPGDIYNYGTQYSFIAFGIIGMAYTINTLYLPVFVHLNISSSYEYLEHRFQHRCVRALSAMIFVIDEFLTVPLYMYVPCVALEAVTTLSRTYIAPTVMIICIVYTSLGGLKAVVWTDALQISIFFVSIVVLVLIGTAACGGVNAIFAAAARGNRFIFFEMDPDPATRTTFWGSVVGGYIYWTGFNSVNQTCVQRYLSVPNIKIAKWTVWWFTFGCVFVILCCVYIGLMAYAYYEDCDPVKEKGISISQLIPVLVQDLEGHLPGLAGLFMAGVFSAALSSIATSINSTGGVLLDDFYRGILKRPLSDRKASIFAKLASVIFGFTCVGFMMIIQNMNSVIEMAMSLTGIACGTQFGIFTLGMLNPWATWQGAMAGGIISMLFVSWCSIGAAVFSLSGELNYPKLPTSVSKCPDPKPTVVPDPTMSPHVLYVYKISFLWTAAVGFVVVMVVGSLVSLIWLKETSCDDVDTRHFFPPIAWCLDRRRARKEADAVKNGEVQTPSQSPGRTKAKTEETQLR